MTRRCARSIVVGCMAVGCLARSLPAAAHQGPPFPLISAARASAYTVDVWTDPDSTDDGTPGGRFWVTLQPAQPGGVIAASTSVSVSITPSDRDGRPISAPAPSIDNDPARRFVALLMEHEGPFRVNVTIDGPLGHASVDTNVDATYDLRPPPFLMVVFVMPFVLVGFLWVKLLTKRRRAAAAVRWPR